MKRKTIHKVTTTTEGEGYKGHKAKSRIGDLHRCFDERGEDAARKLGEKLGLAAATIGIQFGRFRKDKPSKPTTGKKVRKSNASDNTHDEAVAIEA